MGIEKDPCAIALPDAEDSLEKIQIVAKKLSDDAKKLIKKINKAKRQKQDMNTCLKNDLDKLGYNTFTTNTKNLIADLFLLSMSNIVGKEWEYPKAIKKSIKMHP